ncbi:SLC13 family permease [Nocardia sp. NPDC059195]
MTGPIATTFVVLTVAIVAFMSNRIPPGVVALGVALALYLTGTIGFEDAIAGFGDPVVVYLAALFVISEAIDATGVTAWVGMQLIRRVGSGRTAVLVAVMLLCAALTALISVNGAVAALIPVTVMIAAKIVQRPAQLLMPLAFAAHAGSMLTLLGTPINVMINELAIDAGARPFGFFEFSLVGIPLLIGTVTIVVYLGPRVLPDRVATDAPTDLSRYAETLADHYELDPTQTAICAAGGAAEVVIAPRSEFIGEKVFAGMRTDSGDLVILAVYRGGDRLTRARLRVGDIIVLSGSWDALDERASHPGLLTVTEPSRLRRQATRLGPRSYAAVAVLAVMCALLVVDAAPAAIVALGAATAMLALRVITVSQAEHAISLTTLVIVAGMIPMATAMQSSGAAELISRTLLDLVGTGSPLLLQFGIVAVVIVLGQFISNLATVLIVAPIAVSVAAATGISPLPMLMAMTVAGAASFLTPIATAANLMVAPPGAYRFGDYWKLGLPLAALFAAVATFLVPLIWPF